MNWLSFVLFTLLSLWVATSFGEESTELQSGFVKPRVAVPLIVKTKVRPALGTIVGNALYFSEVNFDEPCLGDDVYRVELGKREVSQVAEASCVTALHPLGSELQVTTKDEGTRQLKVSEGGEGQWQKGGPARDFPKLNMYLHQLQAKKGLRVANAKLYKTAHFGTVLRSFLQVPGNNDWFSVVHDTSKKRGGTSVTPLKLSFSPIEANVLWDGQGRAYIQREAHKDMATIGVLNIETGRIQTFGIATPYAEETPWNSLDRTGEEGWAIRSPKFMTATNHGLLVYDATSFQTEWQTISFLSPGDDKAYRVQLPDVVVNDVAGMSLAHGGIVITQAEHKRILWFGQKTPFGDLLPIRPAHMGEASQTELESLRGDDK